MKRVAVLGATGAVGQRFVSLLDEHPDFTLEAVVASEKSVGKRYADAAPWILDAPRSESADSLPCIGLPELDNLDLDVAFSALPGGIAGPTENRLAESGVKVFTNARDHRMAPDVPLLIPEVNPGHLRLIERQPTHPEGGWIVANGNCSGIILTMALAPIHRAFGLETVHVTTLQGLSGAGYPGVSAMDIVDNVLPFIGGEEDKLESEPQKALGALGAGGIEHARFSTRATATRVPVREGHLESVHVQLSQPAKGTAIEQTLSAFRGPPELAGLRHAPERPIHVLPGMDRPQPRRDRDIENGMAISVGRIRVTDDGCGVQMVVLGHNTMRGAAGQSLLNAEYALATGRL